MGKDKRDTAVVFDANVVFAALVRPAGFNRLVLTVTPSLYPSYYPSVLRDEVLRYVSVIAQRASLPVEDVTAALEEVLSPLREVDAHDLAVHSSDAEELVQNPGDAIYVALALHLRRRLGYREVVIVTWNKRDYNANRLAVHGITVLTPPEFCHKYLKNLSPHTACHQHTFIDARTITAI
ncbi:PIN domain-containing protein [Pyrodictium abyssi]|uniref:PIN domain-containing protein n=1 Tax=Pyrodictium abyssi TaxID=54256 RepID=A0ABN6ZNR4_9CREN|nr:hypothetical protein PABY_05960 [Pyrodictium abyssi]